MPELPEVETTRRGILSGLEDRRVAKLVVREARLRWPVPPRLPDRLRGQTLEGIRRRGKYLLFQFRSGTLLVHLGMSGSLRFVEPDQPPAAHDHIDLVMSNGQLLRYHDPRRFGTFLWQCGDASTHPLLRELGPEPLQGQFDADHMYRRSRGRRTTVKQFLMDARIVVGVGNIYANEALFLAGIHPLRRAGGIGRERYERLVQAVRRALSAAIESGGTTLRDYVKSDGVAGGFALELFVYGRDGQPCRNCGGLILQRRVGQRSTFYCRHCQR